ncbi:MAG: ABC transporter ATP-binding protein [Alphaproteobacteria bacterium]|nr:ABC transporter ATP-binding protein [Alphaproteobacteria bacterium]
MAELLKIESLTWKSKAGQSILNPVSFEINSGRVLGIVGANGAGKSTLLRLLYRFHRPTSGKITLNGRDIWRFPAKEYAQKVAVVLQEHPIDFGLSVREIVTLGRTPYQRGLTLSDKRDKQFIDHALDRLNLSHMQERRFSTLSGGEKQRVMVARALAQDPEIIILDEPTNHLDIRRQLEVLNLVRNLGLTIIYSIHDLNMAAEYSDDVLILSQGSQLAFGQPQDILTENIIEEAFAVKACQQILPVTGQKHFSFALASNF